eukprot:gene10503-14115_t
MFTIWSKVDKNSNSEPAGTIAIPNKNNTSIVPAGGNEEEKYYYSASIGHIVSTDGNNYVIPALTEKHITKTEFIPYEYAHDKISLALKETKDLKDAYQEHIEALNNHHKSNLESIKIKYESLIHDMREKALRHVDIQKQLKQKAIDELINEKKEIENKYKHELVVNEEKIEELRDTMAASTLEYQEETRQLKNQHAEIIQENQRIIDQKQANIDKLMNELDFISTKLIASQESLTTQKEELTDEIQSNQFKYEQQVNELMNQYNQEKQELVSHYESIIANDRLKYEQRITNLTDNIIFEQVNLTICDIINQINENDIIHQHHQLINNKHNDYTSQSSNQQVLINTLNSDIHELQSKVYIIENNLNNREVELCLHNIITNIIDDHHKIELKSKISIPPIINLTKTTMNETPRISPRSNLPTHSKSVDDTGDNMIINSLKVENSQLLNQIKSLEEKLKGIMSNNSNNSMLITSNPITPRPPDETITNIATNPLFLISPRGQEQLENDKKEYDSLINQKELATIRLSLISSTLLPDIIDINLKLTSEKDSVKQEIKVWTKEFQDLNHREPDVQDKASIKDKYQKYKLFTSKLKEIENDLKNLENEKKELINNVTIFETSLETEKYTNSRFLNYLEYLSTRNAAVPVVVAPIKEELLLPFAEEKKKSIDNNNDDKNYKNDDKINYNNNEEKNDISNQMIIIDPQEKRKLLEKIIYLELELQKAQKAQLNQSRGASLRASALFSTNNNTSLAESILGSQGQNNLTGQSTEGMNEKDILIQQLEEANRECIEALEQLEDQLFSQKQEFVEITQQFNKINDEKKLIENQLESLIKEKRTDVVKRYEEDIEELFKKQTELIEKVASLSAEKIKNESKILELKSRAELAENELKERDLGEVKQLNPTEEKAILKTQINKQRDQIILKSKAATAGWDAAANSDERLDVEVERAYKRGLLEAKNQHKIDM